MPGRDYGQAFALFENSLRGSKYLGEYGDRYPHTFSNHFEASHSNRTSVTSFDNEDDEQYEDEGLPAIMLSSPATDNQSQLPPTPPSNVQDENDLSDLPTMIQHDSIPQRQSLSTPTNNNSLPTPDITPPKKGDRVMSKPFAQLGSHSPYAESFRTANEDKSASNLDLNSLGLNGTSQSHSRTLQIEADRTVPLSSSQQGLGLSNGLNGIHLRHDIDEVRLINGESDPTGLEAVRTLEEYPDSLQKPQMRHVRGGSVGNDENIPMLMRGLSLQNGVRRSPDYPPRTPPLATSEDGDQSSTLGSLSSSPMRKAYKRFSQTPGSSPIVEAVIIDSPPQRKRKLRHVHKTPDLRDELSGSDISNRNSISTDGTPLHKLTHKKRFSNGSQRDSGESQFSLRDFQNFALTNRLVSGSPSGRPATAPEDYENSIIDKYKRSEERTSFIDARRSVSDPLQSAGGPSRTLTNSSRDIDIIMDEALQRLHSPAMREASEDGTADFREHVAEETQSPQSLIQSNEEQFASAEQLPRPSLDRDTERTESLRRGSPALRPSDGSPGKLQTLQSPISTRSGVSEPWVSEAQAITIYPHNNRSLLVVQQPASMEVQQLGNRSLPSALPSTGLSIIQHPHAADGPSTPPFMQPLIAVDSPLKNPRQAPMPPVVTVIPPTPANDTDTTPSKRPSLERPTTPTPARRVSLLQRARQYSGTLMQPLVVGPGSLRLRPGSGGKTSRNPRNNQKGQLSPPPVPGVSEPSQQDGRLHPFWQPRGFWNDLEDSDDDYDDEYDDYDNDAASRDRLPRGGDTSDVEEPQPLARWQWRRGGTLRGFLIGNTLDIDRSPTNKRRHVVNLPAGSKLGSNNNYSSTRATNDNRIRALPVITVRQSAQRSGSVRKTRTSNPLEKLKSRMRDRSWRKEQRETDERREALRRSIGPKIVVLNDQGQSINGP